MIIHKLIAHHLKHRDDSQFYEFQAQDAIDWIEKSGVPLGSGVRVLDLGCGHGIFGAQLARRGCQPVFADAVDMLRPDLKNSPFKQIDIDRDGLGSLGEYNLVVCSNVFEHLSKPDQFLATIHKTLTPQGKLYLSWTNWLSPWGGHEFSPFHYLGTRRGYKLYDKIIGKRRNHTPYENLFPTYIGHVLKQIRQSPTLKIIRAAPRYYTEAGFLLAIPLAREFLTWNCALLIGRKT
jgi:2-polyprenyl-3-methyl-5-hydroxy-6-metoxy-1,4-benzoquinol methylase